MKETKVHDSVQQRWARFRFSVIGPLLAAPPNSGELKNTLTALAKTQWQHPLTGLPIQYGASTIERWYYQAKDADDPIFALMTKRRRDAKQSRTLSPKLKECIRSLYLANPHWSSQLLLDNLKAICQTETELGNAPSYSTLARYMKANGLLKQRQIRKNNTQGAMLAANRLASREVRSFELEHVHALWHLDFHHGSRNIVGQDGKWHKPYMLAIIDDRSRLICHAQWFCHEDTHALVHGFKQALQKRGLPRALMTDNGSAMTSAEFTQGLERLGILHQTTLPYSPYQNAKQEIFWAQVEGRLMAMLTGDNHLTLGTLNQATLAWIELEYHRKVHSELKQSPLDCLLQSSHVARNCPNTDNLNQAFTKKIVRSQRRSDGTIPIDGKRFEVPSQYRHMQSLNVRYASWDLRDVYLVDEDDKCIDKLYPLDKRANSDRKRRTLTNPEFISKNKMPPNDMAPLLKNLMADYAATGLPPAYLPQPGDDHAK